MTVPRIGHGTRIASPSASNVRIRQPVQQNILVFPRQIPKRRLESPHAFAIHISQRIQKRSLRLGRLGSQHKIDIAIHQRFLSAWSVCRWDNQVAEHNQRFILMLIQEKWLPSWRRKVFRGVHTALRRRQLGWLLRRTLRRRAGCNDSFLRAKGSIGLQRMACRLQGCVSDWPAPHLVRSEDVWTHSGICRSFSRSSSGWD